MALNCKGIRSNGSLFAGTVITSVMMITAIAGVIHPLSDPYALDIAHRFAIPSWQHWMGTDEYGRDLFSRVAIALANSLQVAISALLIGFVAGILIGGISGFIGGWIGEVLMRFMDGAYAFPHLILSMLFITVLGPGRWPVILAIGIFTIPVLARLTFSSVLEGKNQMYVIAAQSMGGKWHYVLRRHVIFFAAPTILVQLASSFSGAILTEAALSFLGLGIQPPQPSLGGMLTSSVNYLSESVLLSVFPGLTLLIVVMGINLLGDGLEGRFGRW